MLTIDTNILIAYLGGEENVILAIKEWRRNGITLFISSITECELLSYPKLTQKEEKRMEQFLLENFIAFPFDGVRARKAALIRRTLPSLKLPDAAIAALAKETYSTLVTRNIRDFKKIPNLPLLKI